MELHLIEIQNRPSRIHLRTLSSVCGNSGDLEIVSKVSNGKFNTDLEPRHILVCENNEIVGSSSDELTPGRIVSYEDLQYIAKHYNENNHTFPRGNLGNSPLIDDGKIIIEWIKPKSEINIFDDEFEIDLMIKSSEKGVYEQYKNEAERQSEIAKFKAYPFDPLSGNVEDEIDHAKRNIYKNGFKQGYLKASILHNNLINKK